MDVTLRQKGGDWIRHLANIAPGQRERDPRALGFLNLHVEELPPTPACRVSLRLAERPRSVTLQPQDKAVTDWTWGDGSPHLALPSFETHQMVVIASSENSL